MWVIASNVHFISGSLVGPMETVLESHTAMDLQIVRKSTTNIKFDAEYVMIEDV